MKIKYIDLIDRTFYFPQEEFRLEDNSLLFHNIPLQEVIEKHGTPLKFTYLPKISENIQNIKRWFKEGMRKVGYKGKYYYCYCTKSSHFSYVLDEVMQNDVHIETSSAFDLDIIASLKEKGSVTFDTQIICNGFKTENYLQNIVVLKDLGFKNIIPVIDNFNELDRLLALTKKKFNIGIRIAAEEEPKFEFYTSRLGIGYKDIMSFYKNEIAPNKQIKLKMLHFFINTGIRDTAYYWNELMKCLKVYASLKRICPSLDSLNIGGGFPIKNSLSFEYDYSYMISEIIQHIQAICQEENIEEPNIYTEFGSYTVGESGGMLFKVLDQKQQNDREKWNMIDASFMTTMPDAWALSKRFIMLPINNWNDEYERVFLGGLTCDSDDYYNSEQHINAIYLPKFRADKPMYLGFFNTGAYQDSLSGYGGIKHCLIPDPKQILIDRDENGELTYQVFSEANSAQNMLKLLGYQK